jgi:hypothetical protein
LAATKYEKQRTVFRPNDYPFTELAISDNTYSLKIPSFHNRNYAAMLMIAAGIEFGAHSYHVDHANGRRTITPVRKTAYGDTIDYERMKSPLAHVGLIGATALSEHTGIGFTTRNLDAGLSARSQYPQLHVQWYQASQEDYHQGSFEISSGQYADLTDTRIQNFLRASMAPLKEYDRLKAIFFLTYMQLYGEERYEEHVQPELVLRVLADEW